MKLPKNKTLRLFLIPAHLIGVALHTISDRIGFRLCRRTTHVIIGIVLVLTGSFIAHLGSHLANQAAILIVDAFGYSIHGFGLAPILKVLADALEMEI